MFASGRSNSVSPKTSCGTMLNFKPIDECIYIFDEYYNGSRRLNVVAHGSEGVMHSSEGVIGPETLFGYLLNANVNMLNYQNVRLLSCYSSSGEKNSFAYRFAQICGMPTLGYVGPMTGNFTPEGVLELMRGHSFDDVIAVFSAKNEFRVDERNPYSPFKNPINYLSFRHQPRTFYPVGWHLRTPDTE
ncbi:hypothetical protein [Burkholderia ubonensis]|uniref:hypothetical protein n=1 Tax=Burkholderia ubonensis TaxID=101571 RepID=UPI0012F94EF7|nr:hypothetical protein [Burkholderia ubonensis]